MLSVRRNDNDINPRGLRWCFTWNNYSENWKEILGGLMTKLSIKFLIAEEEVAPSTGTHHIQGYFRSNKMIYKNTLTQNVQIPWYVEPAKGSEAVNIQYCTKDIDGNLDDPRVLELGIPIDTVANLRAEDSFQRYTKCEERKLRKKEDFQTFLNDCLNMTNDELEAKYPSQVFHQRAKIESWKIEHMSNSVWQGELNQKNFWIWGPTGTGKSRWSHNQAENDDEYYSKMWNRWWSGYNPLKHKVVGLEDYPSLPQGQILGQLMKIWADRYSFQAEIKGSSLSINPGKFILIVTSNYSIDECFEEKDAAAIKRRFKEVRIENQNDIFLSTVVDKSILN